MFCYILDCIFNVNILDFIKNNISIIIATITCFITYQALKKTQQSNEMTKKSLEMTKQQFDWVREDREKEKQKIIKKIEHIIDCCLIEIIKEEKILPYPYEVAFEITSRVLENEEYENKYFFYSTCVQDFSKRLGHIVLDLNKFKNSDECKKYEDYEKYKDEKIKKKCETIYNENKYLTTEILDAMIDVIHKYISENINATY